MTVWAAVSAAESEATMSETEKQEIDQVHQRAHEWFVSLSPAEKVQLLKDTGILDVNGILSSSYGGPGEPTRDNTPPRTAS